MTGTQRCFASGEDSLMAKTNVATRLSFAHRTLLATGSTVGARFSEGGERHA